MTAIGVVAHGDPVRFGIPWQHLSCTVNAFLVHPNHIFWMSRYRPRSSRDWQLGATSEMSGRIATSNSILHRKADVMHVR